MLKPKYFHELTLEEMFKCHDHTYSRSDDHRYWKKGRQEEKIIQDKVKEMGGWNKKKVELWNKYAPKHDSFQKNMEWIEKYEQ